MIEPASFPAPRHIAMNADENSSKDVQECTENDEDNIDDEKLGDKERGERGKKEKGTEEKETESKGTENNGTENKDVEHEGTDQREVKSLNLNCTDDEKLEELDSGLNDNDFLRINVCGMIYETLEETLQRFPETLLGNKQQRQEYFVRSRNAYFFDRNRASFEAILSYYQSDGRLVRPATIPIDLFLEELHFFALGEDTILKFQQEEGLILREAAVNLPKRYWQRKVWELFEISDSSFFARILAFWSLSIIALSITVFCMETMPLFKNQVHDEHLSKESNLTHIGHGDDSSNEQPWFSLEMGCVIWFTIEYVVRLIASPSKCEFMTSMLNIIDLLAILPYFVILTINSGSDTTPLSVLRVVRLVRVFRVFKLSRHSIGLQILGHTLRASISELGMLVFFVLLGIILFSSAIFYAENAAGSHEDPSFSSIPDAFWYSIVTMTTVGYGDKVPKTLVGKLIGSLCAVTGVLTISLPVPVIVSNFSFFYKQNQKVKKSK